MFMYMMKAFNISFVENKNTQLADNSFFLLKWS